MYKDKVFQALEDSLEDQSIKEYEKCGRCVPIDTGITICSSVGPYKIVAIPPKYEEFFDTLRELAPSYGFKIVTDLFQKVFGK
jgi:hypothetical protein